MDVAKYRDLFIHRSDVFAEQQTSGAYYPVKRELTNDELDEHLGGVASYGVYVIDPEPADGYRISTSVKGAARTAFGGNTVKYVVFDLDTYSPEAFEWLIHCCEELLAPIIMGTSSAAPQFMEYRYRCLLMENSGGKGFHAWLFLSEPVPAAKVRRWIARDFTPEWEKQASNFDGTPLEIFPKQDSVEDGGFGNLVKLPFGVHAKSVRRSELVPYQGWADSIDNVCKLDSRLIPDVPVSDERSSGGSRSEAGPRTAPFACIAKLIESGAPAGNRDNAMFHFARYACGSGLPEDLVFDWCRRVNENFSPPMSLNVVHGKVKSASAMKSPHPGCNADWLKGFCPGGENCFAPWNDDRPNHRKPVVDDGTDYLSLSPEERRKKRENDG